MRIDNKEIDFYKYCKTCKNRKNRDYNERLYLKER